MKKMPVILKVAVSPMRIMQAGMKRVNTYNRDLINLLKEKPMATTSGGAYMNLMHNLSKRKDLLDKADKSIKQVDNMLPSMFKRDLKHGGTDYNRARDHLLSRFKHVRNNINNKLYA